MKMFRCHNPACVDDPEKTNRGHEFLAEQPICDKCKAGADPRTANYLQPLLVIHFDPPLEGFPEIAQHVRACDPRTSITAGRGSAVAVAVNCPLCKQTPAYLSAMAAVMFDEEHDIRVTIKTVTDEQGKTRVAYEKA